MYFLSKMRKFRISAEEGQNLKGHHTFTGRPWRLQVLRLTKILRQHRPITKTFQALVMMPVGKSTGHPYPYLLIIHSAIIHRVTH